MKTVRFEFDGSEGQALAGALDLPDGEVRGYALFAHCFTCGKDLFAAAGIARALAGHGLGVLRFDFTGLGDSGGEFANTNFSSNVADLVAAASHLRRVRAAPVLLVGHSLGGAAVLAATARIPEVRAVATLAAPSDPAHVTGLFRDSVDEIAERGEADVQLGPRTFRVQRQFLADVREQNLARATAELGRPLLVLHSPADTTVPIANATRIFAAAAHPKSFVSLDDAKHLLPRESDAAYAGQVIAAWSTRYLGAPR